MESTQPTAPPPTINTGTSLVRGTDLLLKSPCSFVPLLEEQLQRKLQLPRIEHRSGGAEKRIRHGRSGQGTPARLAGLDGQACGVLVLPGLPSAAEIIGAIDADD